MKSWRQRGSFHLLALGVSSAVGCASASSYTPRPSPRISFIQAPGGVKLTHDSKTFGIWSVDEAVAGNPQAEAEARTYVRRTATGLVLDFAGVGMLATGIALGSSSHTRREVGDGLKVGGLVTLIPAMILLFTGPGHLYDAIKIYNDAVPAGPRD